MSHLAAPWMLRTAPRAAGGALPVYRDTGAVQSTNPLPVGSYWVDVFEKDFLRFESWVKHYETMGALRVVSLESKEGDLFRQIPRRRWYLFEVKLPSLVFWLGPGLPTIATPDVQTSDDTVQKPAPTSAGEAFDEIVDWLFPPGDGSAGPFKPANLALVAGGAALAWYVLKQQS